VIVNCNQIDSFKDIHFFYPLSLTAVIVRYLTKRYIGEYSSSKGKLPVYHQISCK